MGFPLRPPAGLVVFAIAVTDEAGNAATGLWTLPVYARGSPALTVMDGRGVSSGTSLRTGGPASRSPAVCVLGSTCTAPLVVVASFSDPVAPLGIRWVIMYEIST